MTVDRWLAGSVAGWTLLASLLAAGLAAMATAVETARHGASVALQSALLMAPEVLVPLSPLLCAVGAALAAARMEVRGERVGLQAVGLGWGRTVRAAVAVGLLAGFAQWTAAGFVVPRAEAARLALLGSAGPTWVWVDGTAVRLSDGLQVEVADGYITQVRRDRPVDPERLALARMAQEPRIASAETLARTPGPLAALERLARLARIAACAGLAAVGWLPLSSRPASQVGRALGLGLSWLTLDLVLQAMGAQGSLPPWVGGAGGALLLWGVLTGLALAGGAIRRP